MEGGKRILVGITGASGALYGVRLCKALIEAESQLHVIISKAGEVVSAQELDLNLEGFQKMLQGFAGTHQSPEPVFHDESDFAAGPASGSFPLSAMCICPCTMATLGAIASGNGRNLIHRAADVTLKERRPPYSCAPRDAL